MRQLPVILLSVAAQFLTGISGCAPTFFQKIEKNGDQFAENHPSNLHTLNHAGKSIGYFGIGDANKTKIIFVHGSPGGWKAFYGFLANEELQKAAYLISPDRPGYGTSEHGKTERSLSVQADAMMGLLDLGDPTAKVILVGHSYGGAVVARMAMSGDPRISSIVIVAGSVDPSQEKTKWFQYPAEWWIFKWMVPENLRVCNEEIFALKAGLEEALPLWKNIKAHVTVIHGTSDSLVPIENADFIERQIPKRQLRVIKLPNTEHFIPWQQPEVIQGALNEELHR